MFRLALALGMTVRELESRMGAQELEEWREFYQLEPWGFLPEEFRAASWRAMYANSHRASRKDPAFSPVDFMPDHPEIMDAKRRLHKERRASRQTPEDMKRLLMQLVDKGGDHS